MVFLCVCWWLPGSLAPSLRPGHLAIASSWLLALGCHPWPSASPGSSPDDPWQAQWWNSQLPPGFCRATGMSLAGHCGGHSVGGCLRPFSLQPCPLIVPWPQPIPFPPPPSYSEAVSCLDSRRGMCYSPPGLWSLNLASTLPEKNENTAISVFILRNDNLEVFRVGFITPSNAPLQSILWAHRDHNPLTLHHLLISLLSSPHCPLYPAKHPPSFCCKHPRPFSSPISLYLVDVWVTVL